MVVLERVSVLSKIAEQSISKLHMTKSHDNGLAAFQLVSEACTLRATHLLKFLVMQPLQVARCLVAV